MVGSHGDFVDNNAEDVEAVCKAICCPNGCHAANAPELCYAPGKRHRAQATIATLIARGWRKQP